MKKCEFITTLCQGKRVLDIGAAEYDYYHQRPGYKNYWLHGKIFRTAYYTVGIDMDRETVKILNHEGFRFYVGHAEYLDRVKALQGQKFDIIVAGDLIEHLANPGLFLEGLKLFCHSQTQIVITTPNILAFYYWRTFIRKGWEFNADDHLVIFTPRILIQLLQACNYEILERRFNTTEQIINGIRPAMRRLLKWILPHMSHKIMIVCRPKEL